ncbi:hypothetical protein ACP275_10G126400 [Erythranthe tilingii]
MGETNRMSADKYGECNKSHEELSGGKDGCLEFVESSLLPIYCKACGCHQNYHRKVIEYKRVVIYGCCKRVHNFQIEGSWDGCQQFYPKGGEFAKAALECEACGCYKSFHRSVVPYE